MHDRLPVSESDDSDFEVGGVRAALQSLEDDAETAERVTTPEKQTWWKNKLKHSAICRVESAHSLVRPWESRQDVGRSSSWSHSAFLATTRVTPQLPAAVGDDKRVSGRSGMTEQHHRTVALLSNSSDGEEGWCSAADGSANGSDRQSPGIKIDGRVSPRYAMPLMGDSHVRKPSLSVILNMENKNSHLRGNSDYDSAPILRDGEYTCALKPLAQLRCTVEPNLQSPVSRSRGRIKPSESALPPDAAELTTSPSRVLSLASEGCHWPDSEEPSSSEQSGRDSCPRPAATLVSGALGLPGWEPSAAVTVAPELSGPCRPVSHSPPWDEESARPLTVGAGLPITETRPQSVVAGLLHSPSSYHGSPASSSSFSSSGALVTATAASDAGTSISPAPRLVGLRTDGDSEMGSESSRRAQSMLLIRRRRMKLLKRKHKNIVDPVLLADVEELVRRLGCLAIPRGGTGRTGDARTPACFQTKKYGRKRKQPLEKMARPDRETGDGVDKKKASSAPPACSQVS